jgi:hypothetical protein
MTPWSADASAAYAVEVARLLWPAPWGTPFVTRERHRAAPAHRDAYVLPRTRRPRVLVPTDRPGAASMAERVGRDGSLLTAPTRRLLAWSVRARLLDLGRWPVLRVEGRDPGADSIEQYLSERLGTDVRVGILLGTRRVNQKPVLQLFGADGTTLGYAKVGHNDLTAALVRREATALARVVGRAPRTFRVPEVLHEGRWAGLEVLVLSPLGAGRREPVSGSALLAAERELAGLEGTTTSVLADSSFWSRVRGTAAELREATDGHRLRTVVAHLEARHGADRLDFGAWHGDWGDWNMGMAGGALHVWDWERYDPAVPVGFDTLHHAAQGVRPGEREAARQESAFLGSVPGRLALLGVGTDRHDVTLRLYLVEIALRYLDALTHGATPALRRRTSWVLSLLERLCERPLTAASEGRP